MSSPHRAPFIPHNKLKKVTQRNERNKKKYTKAKNENILVLSIESSGQQSKTVDMVFGNGSHAGCECRKKQRARAVQHTVYNYTLCGTREKKTLFARWLSFLSLFLSLPLFCIPITVCLLIGAHSQRFKCLGKL